MQPSACLLKTRPPQHSARASAIEFNGSRAHDHPPGVPQAFLGAFRIKELWESRGQAPSTAERASTTSALELPSGYRETISLTRSRASRVLSKSPRRAR